MLITYQKKPAAEISRLPVHAAFPTLPIFAHPVLCRTVLYQSTAVTKSQSIFTSCTASAVMLPVRYATMPIFQPLLSHPQRFSLRPDDAKDLTAVFTIVQFVLRQAAHILPKVLLALSSS